MSNITSSRKRQGRFTSAPVVSGSTTVGSVISTTNGTFTGPSSTYTYQWFLDGSPISGAISNTYTLPAISNGILKCVVKATNARGSIKATSNYFIIRNSFDFVVKTDNTSSGSSTATQFKLPLISTGTYNFTVYWGDGTSNTITTWNQAQTTHTYATAGTYNVSVVGTCHGFCFNNTGDRLKLLTVKWWGNGFRPNNNYGTFFGCHNLKLENVRDVIDLTGMTAFNTFFYECLSLVKVNRINEWNTSNITSLNRMFEGSPIFNDNIGGWNTSNVTDMNNVFAGAQKFNNGGSPDINNWDTSKVTSMAWMFGADGTRGILWHEFNQPIGDWNTSACTSMYTMFWRNRKFNQDLNTKVVTKNGVTYTAWDTKNVVDMRFMLGCNSATGPGEFNGNISNWNTVKVTNTSSMLQNQPNFNQDINTKVVTINGTTYTAWNTENVTNMSYMLYASTVSSRDGVFNRNISNWNTSKVTDMYGLLYKQPEFNQDISTKVVTLNGVTYTAWDIKNVTRLAYMLFQTSGVIGKFNQNIGNWNTSKVNTTLAMLQFQTGFNQNIGTKSVTVNGVTYTAWDTTLVTNISYMFAGCSAFNNGGSNTINDWNVANVTALSQTFSKATAFNQPLNNWNTVKVTNMAGTFSNATSFNQSISNWKANLVTTFNDIAPNVPAEFMEGKTYNDYSAANYDALLIGWASRPVLANKTINFGTIKYTSAAVAARAILTSAPNNWTIIDGGQI